MKILNYIGLGLISLVLPAQIFCKEPITTREGRTFTIKLTSSSATGFDWFWGNEKELKDYIQLVKSEFVGNPLILSGRIGKKIFTFKALKYGKVTIKFNKRKSWEETVVDHAWIRVNIKKADYSPTGSR